MNRNVQAITRQGIGEQNEDVILLDEERQLFAVFDGASSLDHYHNKAGQTGGSIAAQTAKESFLQQNCKSLVEYFKMASDAIERSHINEGIDVSDPLHRFGTTVAAVWVHHNSIELLQCGDSTIIVIDLEGKATLPLGHENHDTVVLVEWKKLADAGKIGRAEIRPAIGGLVDALRRNANNTYGVLNGDPRAETFVRHTIIPRTDAAHILLLTDGMYIPKTNPLQPDDWQKYATLYSEGGLSKLYAYVRSLELSDPDQVIYPRYKLHDDASAIAINLQ